MHSNSFYCTRLRLEACHPRIIAYYFKQWNGFTMPPHRHNAVEIMHVITGSCVVEVDGRQLAMRKGDFILIDANVHHRLLVEEGTPCRMLNIEFIFESISTPAPSLKTLSEDSPELARMMASPVDYRLLRDPDETYHTLRSLILELDAEGPGAATRAPSLLVHLLMAQLLVRIARLVDEQDRESSSRGEAYVRQAIAFMHQQYDRDIRVEDIAAAVNVHPAYLHRIFRLQTDSTVMDYLNAFRMDKAKMLLTHTNIPVLDIAAYAGINSRQYFSSLFKKYTGQTPTAYRKAYDRTVWTSAD